MLYHLNLCFIKKIALLTLVFFASLLPCMQQPQLINCGLIDIFIPNDLVGVIKSHCTLQDIGRLKSLNNAAYNYWNTENCDCSLGNLSFACQNLKACSYHTRTKVLAHYTQTKNRIMFQHIWSWNAELRNNDLRLLCQEDLSTWTLEDKMTRYRSCYSSPEKRDRTYYKQILYALSSLSSEHRETIKKTFLKSEFNIYESKYIKKNSQCSLYRKILSEVSLRQDVDLLLVIIGGVIKPYMFKSLFKHLNINMLNNLDERNLIPLGIDQYGKSAYDYYRKKVFSEKRGSMRFT